jgi:hypothetical protein
LSHHQGDTTQGIVGDTWVYIFIAEYNSCTRAVQKVSEYIFSRGK